MEENYWFVIIPFYKGLIGLNSVTVTGEECIIKNNSSIENLIGLGALQSVGNYFSVKENLSLINLQGVENLETIGGYLKIKDNPIQTSFEGLDNLDCNSIIDMYIEGNPSLAACEIPLICDYLSNGGYASVFGNGNGCEDLPKVNESCGNCAITDVMISTPTEVDSFASSHPNCGEVLGNIMISGQDITNLNGLSGMTNIKGGVDNH